MATIAHLILANCADSIGWGLFIVWDYHFSTSIFLTDTRWLQYIVGTLFSIVITVSIYYHELYYVYINTMYKTKNNDLQ